MNIFTRVLSFVNFNNQIMNWVKFNGQLVYEAFKKLLVSGIPPLTLLKSKGVDLVDYKIYGNSVQNGTPTPETPIEVESVGDMSSNLYKFPYDYMTRIDRGVTFTALSDGRVRAKGTQTDTLNTFIPYTTNNWKEIVKNFEVGKTYYISANPSSPQPTGLRYYMMAIVQKANGTTTYPNSTITLEEGDTLSSLQLRVYSTDGVLRDIDVIFSPMVSEVTTEFEPYGKYKIPVKTTGKNIADPKQVQRFVDGMQALGGTGAYTKFQTDENGRQILCLYCASAHGTPNYNEVRKIFTGIFKENTRYTLSFDFYNSYSSPGDKTATNLSVYYTDGTYATNDEIFLPYPIEKNVVHHYTFTSKVNKTISKIQLNYNNGTTYIYMDTLQLEEGTVETEYEEYKETVTNIYLNEPLRKIGSRADYIDFENGKVIRKIKELISNGTENWIIVSYYLSNCFNLNIKDMVNNEQGAGLLLYSTYFPGSTKWLNYNQRLNIITAYRQHLGIGFTDGSGNNSVIGTTVDEFKAWLKAQYDNGTPLKIYYPLQTQAEESIGLPQIPTHKGTTIIEVDTSIRPSNMEVTYLGKE